MRSLLPALLLALSACVIEGDCPEATEPTQPDGCHTGDEPPIVLACNEFNEARTLENDPQRPVDYVLDCQAGVQDTLTIEPGVVIAFGADGAFELGDDGRLLANGGPGACERIVLQGETEAPGSWLGVLIDGSRAERSELRHTDILGAGGGPINSNGDLGALIVWAESHVVLQDVTVAGSASVGLNANYTGTTLELEGINVFTDNAGAPAYVEPNLARVFRPDDVLSGNGLDALLVQEGELDGDHVWEALDVPYQLTSETEIFYEIVVPDGSSFTLEEGVRVQFEAETGIEAIGDLAIEGTAQAPVELVGTTPGAGTWKGIYLEDPDVWTASYTIDHAVIDGAGGGAFNSNGDLGAIVVWAQTRASVTNTSFADVGTDCAINAPYNEDEIDTSGSTTDGVTLLCDAD